MASAMRLSSSALRTSLKAQSLRTTGFTAARCYSSKSQVGLRWKLAPAT